MVARSFDSSLPLPAWWLVLCCHVHRDTATAVSLRSFWTSSHFLHERWTRVLASHVCAMLGSTPDTVFASVTEASCVLFARAARTWNVDIIFQPSILPSCSVSRGCPKSTCIWTLWEMTSPESFRVLWFNSGYSSYGSVRRLWRDFAHISTWRWTLIPDRGHSLCFWGPVHQVQGRGQLSGSWPIISCMHRGGMWKDTCHQHRVRTTTTITTTATKRLSPSVTCFLCFLCSQTLTVGPMMAERVTGSTRRRRAAAWADDRRSWAVRSPSSQPWWEAWTLRRPTGTEDGQHSSRGGGPRSVRRRTGAEATSSGGAAGTFVWGGRAAVGSHGRLRGCRGASFGCSIDGQSFCRGHRWKHPLLPSGWQPCAGEGGGGGREGEAGGVGHERAGACVGDRAVLAVLRSLAADHGRRKSRCCLVCGQDRAVEEGKEEKEEEEEEEKHEEGTFPQLLFMMSFTILSSHSSSVSGCCLRVLVYWISGIWLLWCFRIPRSAWSLDTRSCVSLRDILVVSTAPCF